MAIVRSQPGDDCPHCDGYLVVYAGRDLKTVRIKYMRCCLCKKPADNHIATPLSQVRRRRKKPVLNNVTTAPAVDGISGLIQAQDKAHAQADR